MSDGLSCVQYRNSLQAFRNSPILEIGFFLQNVCKRFDTERSPVFFGYHTAWHYATFLK